MKKDITPLNIVAIDDQTSLNTLKTSFIIQIKDTPIIAPFLSMASPMASIHFVISCVPPPSLSSSPKVTSISFFTTVIACPIVTFDPKKALFISSVAPRSAVFNTSLVIFPSAARFFNSHRGTHIDFAIISKSIGILSDTARNSSPASLQLPNACDNWSIVLPTSTALAPESVRPLERFSNIVNVSACVPHNWMFTLSNRTKAFESSSIGALVRFARSSISFWSIFK